MLVRCGSCTFEEERELTLTPSTVDILADGPYRDPPRKAHRAKKLLLGVRRRQSGDRTRHPPWPR
jgi:hypothetical protein